MTRRIIANALRSAAVLAAISLATACGDDDWMGDHHDDWDEHHEPVIGDAESHCPMTVPGAEVDYAPIEGGLRLRFTAAPSRTEELQAQVRWLATMYEAHPPHGEAAWRAMDRHHRAMHGAPMPHGPMPAVDARVRPTEGGAILELLAERPEEVEALREHGVAHHDRFRAGRCWVAQT